MKRRFLCASFLLISAVAGADLPTYSGWPRCLPVLGFSADEIGVASLETFGSPTPVQRWVCLVIDRATLIVTPVDEREFDARFPEIRLAGNHGPGDCQEMTRTVSAPPPPGNEPPPTCIDTRVFCDGREVRVQVGAVVAAVRCPGHLFSAATVINGQLWAAVNPLDIYYRDLDGSGLVVQSLGSGEVVARRTSADLGGRSVCAVRPDPVTHHVWATTEAGLAELRPDGGVIRMLRFRATRQPMVSIQRHE